MELFYSENIDGRIVRLDEEESGHCVRVLRHRCGDEISVIDGRGRLMRCRIVDDRPKAVEAELLSSVEGWNAHPYRLTAAVCPTKNIDRFEWFVEKAVEIGVDVIAPVIGEHSERRVVKTQRLEKIVLSAVKQSLKGAIPEIAGPVSVSDFVLGCTDKSRADESAFGNRLSDSSPSPLKLIACCFEDAGHPRKSVKEALEEWLAANFPESGAGKPAAYDENTVHEGPAADTNISKIVNISEIVMLIGPEGDFSSEELYLAMAHGFIPVHLGPSRLRTETAALLCVEAVYAALTL